MIIFLLGPEEFLRSVRLRELRNEIPETEREASISELPGAGLSPEELAATAQALPFFSTRRLVIVSGLLTRSGRGGSDRTDWAGYAAALTALPESTTVVFVEAEAVPDSHPLLKRRQPDWRIERVAAPQNLEAWVGRQAKSKGIAIAPAATALLAQTVGGQLRQLDLELDKLVAYAGDRQVTREDVLELVPAAVSATVFRLADAWLAGRRKSAIQMLHGLLDSGVDPQQIVAILANQLRVVVHLRRHLDSGGRPSDVGSALGLAPRYPLDKVQRQAAALTLESLEAAYRGLLNLDCATKTGRAETTTGLDLLIMSTDWGR